MDETGASAKTNVGLLWSQSTRSCHQATVVYLADLGAEDVLQYDPSEDESQNVDTFFSLY